MKYKTIEILGTNHIAKESITKIKSTFKSFKPDIVCLELDSQRYPSLLENRKQSLNPLLIKKVGVKGYLFALIGGFVQKKLAKKTGYKPGIDMKTASDLAKKNNAQILLIDQQIQRTLWNISHKISKRDKKNFASDIYWSIIFALLGQKLFFKVFNKNKKIINKIKTRILFATSQSFNLNTIPSEHVIEQLMEKVRFIYPSVYKILVSDRNKYMATNLHNIMLKNPDKKILTIVGAGHTAGMIELLKKYDKKGD